MSNAPVEPDVPVTVIVYWPNVVPGSPPPPPVPPPDPPHAATPPVMKIARAASTTRFRHRRRRGTNQKAKQASTGAVAAGQRIHGSGGSTIFAELGSVVVNVNVEVAVLNCRRLTEAGEKLIVGKSCAPAGLAEITAVKATVPTNPRSEMW